MCHESMSKRLLISIVLVSPIQCGKGDSCGQEFAVPSSTYDIRPNRKSLTIGEPANSGFKRTQLGYESCQTSRFRAAVSGHAHFKKYSSPTRRDSKNAERNLTGIIMSAGMNHLSRSGGIQRMLFGGRGGSALVAWGNEARNR